MNRKALLIIIGSLLVIRFLLNYWKMSQTLHYYKKYLEFHNDRAITIGQYKQDILRLLKDANVKDFAIQRLEPAGYGKLKSINASGYDNMFLDDYEVASIMQGKFQEAIGVYRARVEQTFNPLHWADFLFKMPEKLMGYFGVLPEKVIVKVFNLIYWIVLLILGAEKADIINLESLFSK